MIQYRLQITKHLENFSSFSYIYKGKTKTFPQDKSLSMLGVTLLSQISIPCPRYSPKKPWDEFDLISNFGALIVLRILTGSLLAENFHGKKS